jgi:hypothetical protein
MEVIFDRIEAKIAENASKNKKMHHETDTRLTRFVMGQEEIQETQTFIKKKMENTFDKVTLFTEDIMA